MSISTDKMDDEFLKNVFFYHDGSNWNNHPEGIYGAHLENILRHLEKELGGSYYRYRFLVYEHGVGRPYPDFRITGKDVIMIMLSDEDSTVPPVEISDRFFAILKAYYPLEENVRNIIAYPIGYSNSASLCRLIPFEERTFDASYAGNFLPNRLDFYRQFNWLRFLPPFQIRSATFKSLYFKLLTKLGIFKPVTYRNQFGASICYWSDGFAKGLPRQEYADIISNTRIALCPMGFRNTECFRLMETMRLGCVMIADTLPPSRWYKDSPIIIETNWLRIGDTIRNLMKDEDQLALLQKKTLAWWNQVCSDEAVSKYIADEIRRLEAESDPR